MSSARANRRERRDGWAAKGTLRINGERDPLICYAIGRARVLPTRDIAILAFGSRETARDRLRKLHCAGYVRAHVRALAGDNLYTLTERGRDLAVDALGVEPSELVVVRSLPKQLDHLLGVNRMRVGLTVASRALPHEPLRAFVAEWELRAARHATLVGLVPDAIIRLKDSSGVRRHVALEVDTGSENPSYVARRKLALYEQHLAAGLPIHGVTVERIAIVAPGLRRLRSLARAIVDARLRLPVLLADLDAATPSSVFRSWASPARLASSASLKSARALFTEPLVP